MKTCFHQLSNVNTIYTVNNTEIEANQAPIEVKKKPIDYQQYRPYFLQVPVEKIRWTFDSTTQHATNVMEQCQRYPY